MDKPTLNNTIVRMRPITVQAKVHVVHKLTASIKRLKSMKTKTELEQAKNQRKIDRFVEEIKTIKTLKKDEVAKFALSSSVSLDEVMKRDNSDPNFIKDRALARLSENKNIRKKVDEFREKYPNWQKELPKLLPVLGKNREKWKREREKIKLKWERKKKGELGAAAAGSSDKSPETKAVKVEKSANKDKSTKSKTNEDEESATNSSGDEDDDNNNGNENGLIDCDNQQNDINSDDPSNDDGSNGSEEEIEAESDEESGGESGKESGAESGEESGAESGDESGAESGDENEAESDEDASDSDGEALFVSSLKAAISRPKSLNPTDKNAKKTKVTKPKEKTIAKTTSPADRQATKDVDRKEGSLLVRVLDLGDKSGAKDILARNSEAPTKAADVGQADAAVTAPKRSSFFLGGESESEQEVSGDEGDNDPNRDFEESGGGARDFQQQSFFVDRIGSSRGGGGNRFDRGRGGKPRFNERHGDRHFEGGGHPQRGRDGSRGNFLQRGGGGRGRDSFRGSFNPGRGRGGSLGSFVERGGRGSRGGRGRVRDDRGGASAGQKRSYAGQAADEAQQNPADLHPSWAAKKQAKSGIAQFAGKRTTFDADTTGFGQDNSQKKVDANAGRDDTGKLHPSWAAKKQQKDRQGAILPFAGKKIVFDND